MVFKKPVLTLWMDGIKWKVLMHIDLLLKILGLGSDYVV